MLKVPIQSNNDADTSVQSQSIPNPKKTILSASNETDTKGYFYADM